MRDVEDTAVRAAILLAARSAPIKFFRRVPLAQGMQAHGG